MSVQTVSRRTVVRTGIGAAVALALQSRLQRASAQSEPIKIGWSTIYLTPSWMKETSQEIDAELERLRGLGFEIEYQVFDANGDTPTQINQIQTMIDQQYDICLLIAGSATALDQVVEAAHEAGVIVVNWDSLVTTDQLTCKVYEDQVEWGRMTAQWLVDKLGGQGKILAINGPAGIAVSEQRWQGAKEIFDQNPGIEIVGTANIEYNEAPALVQLNSLVTANPELDGIWCQAGAHASAAMKALKQAGMPLVPMTGENFNAFLKQWVEALDEGFSAFATAELNYMAVISLQVALMAYNGEAVPKEVVVPLPRIDDSNVAEWASDEHPDDWYVIPEVPGPEEIAQLIQQALDAESGATPAASPEA
ncbi:MAG TPA: substrate-binding domain-containing protein [Thermomicrobiales bacterium]